MPKGAFNMTTKRVFGKILVVSIVLGSQWLLAQEPKQVQGSPGLIGTWKLISFQDRKSADQERSYPYGLNPQGYIVYDTTGHVFIQMMKTPPYRSFISGDDKKPTPEEAKAVYEGYIAYFGTYSVDEANHVVTHHVEGSLGPSYIGTDQKRPFQLTGDRLILGDDKTWIRVLERVK
jgi:hypothetical protein